MGFLKGLFGFSAVGAGIVAGFGWVFVIILPILAGESPEYVGNAFLWTGASAVAWIIYKAIPEPGEGTEPPANGPASNQSSGYRAFATDYLMQSVASGGTQVSGPLLLDNDAFLQTYHDADVDWHEVWRSASTRSVGVPAFGLHPYWIQSRGPRANLVPLSTLAFHGSHTRYRVAMDRQTPESALRILASDPDPSVRAAARG